MYKQQFYNIISKHGEKICNGCIHYKKTCTLFNSSNTVTDFIKPKPNFDVKIDKYPFYCRKYISNTIFSPIGKPGC